MSKSETDEYAALTEALAKRLYLHYRANVSDYPDNRPPVWEMLTDNRRNAWHAAVKATIDDMNWLIGKEFFEDPA